MATFSSGLGFQHRAAAAGATAPLIKDLIVRFYAKVRRDPALGPVFEEAVGGRWDAHIDKVCSFWLTATRLGAGYKGSDFLPAHMALPAMTPDLLPRWLALFRETADELCPPEAAQALVDIAERMADMLALALARREQGATP